MLIFIYSISLVGVILAFYGMNYLSATINLKSVLGLGIRNGNPALIVLVFAMSFFLYFFYCTIEFSMHLVMKIANLKIIDLCIRTSLLEVIIIGFYTMREAKAFRIEIAVHMETVKHVRDL